VQFIPSLNRRLSSDCPRAILAPVNRPYT